MSSYSDALHSSTSNVVDSRKITDEKIKKKCFGTMQPQPADYLIKKNYGTILLICFILIIIYYQIFLICYPMMIDIHSKHEYFNEQLQIERENLSKFKEELIKTEHYYRYNVSNDNITCLACWSPIWELDFDYIINHVLENNRHIKQLYDDTISPLQRLLTLICCFNTMCVVIIFKKNHTSYFFTSSLFTTICVFIYGEFFIRDKPNVYYTLITGVGIFLFSCFLLIKILLTLLNVLHYQRMKDILTNE